MPENDTRDSRPYSGRRRSLTQELAELDARLLSLLGGRTRLLAKIASARKAKGLSAADPAVEKKLWPQWAEAGKDQGLESKTLHNVFTVLNSLAYERGLGHTGSSRTDPFILAPGPKPLDIEVEGPASLFATKLHLAMAAATGQSLHLFDVVQNDPLVELIKALNQAGGGFSWAESAVTAESGEGAQTTARLIFAGSNPETLSLLTALALPQVGVTKFSGASALKLLDLGPAERLLPRLGGRLHRLDPHAPGLPARLESGGRMASTLSDVSEAPDHLLLALLAMAWSYPDGLRIDFDPARLTPGLMLGLDTVSHVLGQWGVSPKVDGASVEARAGKPLAPEQVRLPLDPVLSAYLIALPLVAVGQIRVKGDWPEWPTAAALLDELASLGLTVRKTEQGLESQAASRPGKAVIGFSRNPELLPLALAVGLGAAQGAELAAPSDPGRTAKAAQLLEHCQADYEIEDQRIVIRPSRISWDAPWSATDPFQCLGCSLLSFLRPGIGLLNPGEITGLWPGWWNVFNRACGARPAPKTKNEDHDDASRKKIRRRRIIAG
jgi:chorismate mutase/5-enolpyruvylshikimate-3-phosphate synthase